MNIMKPQNILRSLVSYKSVSKKMKVDKMCSIIPSTEDKAHSMAASLLREGHVVAVPTDTIYGLACSANCPDAIQKLYKIKGRDSAKPVAICVSYIEDVRKWGRAEHLNQEILTTLLPGPVTVVLEKSKYLDNPYLNPSTKKIGIRIPDNEFINNVTKTFDMPVALTSANYSNQPSTLSIKEFEHLYKYLGAVFDGGILNKGLDQSRTGSTVVDLSEPGYYTIIRKGILFENVLQVLEKHGFVRTT